MLNHILIPLDRSWLAEDAIEPARGIISPNGKITLLSVIEMPGAWGFGTDSVIMFEESLDVSEFMKRANDYLEKIAENLRSDDFQVETVAQYGDPATVIVETASSRKVDAIAMSTHGRSGFSRWLFGSVTGKVLSAAPCPVFVIPSKRQRSETIETAHQVNHH